MRKWSQLRLDQKTRRAWFEATRLIRRACSHAWYWLRSHTWNRYHIINISGQGGYRWGWIDRDHAMYLACFKLLTEFVEREDPQIGTRTIEDYRSEHDDHWREMAEPQVEREREIRALYDWWTKQRPLDWAENKPWNAEYAQKLEDEDDRMLERLMKVRKALWT